MPKGHALIIVAGSMRILPHVSAEHSGKMLEEIEDRIVTTTPYLSDLADALVSRCTI